MDKFINTNLWFFYNPVKVYVGSGALSQLPILTPPGNILLVTSPGSTARGITDRIKGLYGKQQLTVYDKVAANPDLDEIDKATSEIKKTKIRSIIAIGGGSVIDTGKALSVTYPLEFPKALNQILRNSQKIKWTKRLQLIAVPTTAGTGSEVTPFATIWDHKKKKKQSIGGQLLFPDFAIVDPLLTHTLSTEITCYTGLDAINQAAESIWNKNATSMTIALATKSLDLGLDALPKLFEGRGGEKERNQLVHCSLFAGLAISQTMTALCHSISYPLTAHFNVPHGLACAFTMPEVLKLNLTVDDGRFCQLEKHLGLDSLQHTFDMLNERLKVLPQIKRFIPSLEHLLSYVNEMYTPERTDNNLLQIDIKNIEEIIKNSWNR